MRSELRDHSKPCEHVERMIPAHQEAFGVDWLPNSLVRCPWAETCPGGALRVFELDGTGRQLEAGKRGTVAATGRRWQRWVEWLDNERTTQ